MINVLLLVLHRVLLLFSREYLICSLMSEVFAFTMNTRYKGHICEELKIESIFNNTNEFIISGSENGYINIYDLVSVYYEYANNDRQKRSILSPIILNLLLVLDNILKRNSCLLLHLMELLVYGNNYSLTSLFVLCYKQSRIYYQKHAVCYLGNALIV